MSSENLKFKVEPREFNGIVDVPSSKSFANRAIILGCLCPEVVEITNLPLSHDVTNLLNCLARVGLRIVDIENGIRIDNSFPLCEERTNEVIEVKPGDGGTTTRFLIPFLALGQNKYQIEPEGRMRERPIADLLESLISLGVNVSQCDTWLTLEGPLSTTARKISADASKTTQHATALALALCFKGVDVLPLEMSYSKSYWDMTRELMREFRSGRRNFNVPVDFSSMSYILALGADLGSVTVRNCLSLDRYQSDSIFVDILKDMGLGLSIDENGLTVNRSRKLIPIDFNCSNCPDLVPTLAFVCSRVDGESKLRNLSVLKYKESDRLFEVQKLLDLYNIENSYCSKEDVLIINGTSKRSDKAKEIFPPDDHRIVMTSYLFLRANGGGELHSIGSVSKSFANFFEVVENVD